MIFSSIGNPGGGGFFFPVGLGAGDRQHYQQRHT